MFIASAPGSINQESLLSGHLFIYVNFDKAFSEVYKRRTFDIELMSNPFKEVCVANTNLPFQSFFGKKHKLSLL